MSDNNEFTGILVLMHEWYLNGKKNRWNYSIFY